MIINQLYATLAIYGVLLRVEDDDDAIGKDKSSTLVKEELNLWIR